jgi:type V secretory pathway adhesin AidA
VTAPQLATLAKIAKGYNVTIMDLADQKEIDISDPTELSKAQASQLIKEYGIGKK